MKNPCSYISPHCRLSDPTIPKADRRNQDHYSLENNRPLPENRLTVGFRRRVFSGNGRSRWGRRETMNKHRHFHTVEAATCATDEVVPFSLVEGNEVLPTAPVSYSSFRGAVVVASLVHFEDVVLILLVSECCNRRRRIIKVKSKSE